MIVHRTADEIVAYYSDAGVTEEKLQALLQALFGLPSSEVRDELSGHVLSIILGQAFSGYWFMIDWPRDAPASKVAREYVAGASTLRRSAICLENMKEGRTFCPVAIDSMEHRFRPYNLHDPNRQSEKVRKETLEESLRWDLSYLERYDEFLDELVGFFKEAAQRMEKASKHQVDRINTISPAFYPFCFIATCVAVWCWVRDEKMEQVRIGNAEQCGPLLRYLATAAALADRTPRGKPLQPMSAATLRRYARDARAFAKEQPSIAQRLLRENDPLHEFAYSYSARGGVPGVHEVAQKTKL